MDAATDLQRGDCFGIAGITVVAALTSEPPALAVSDDPEVSMAIRRFRESTQRWLVAANMVSEGVDVPRLRGCAWVSARPR